MSARFLRPRVAITGSILAVSILLLVMGGCTRDDGDLSGPDQSGRAIGISGNALYKYPKIVGVADDPGSRTMSISAAQELTEVYFEDFEGFAEPEIESLIEDVENLVAEGALSRGASKGLIAKLKEALKNLSKDNDEAAVNKVSDFIDQVNALINSGALEPEEGQLLINAAEIIVIKIYGGYEAGWVPVDLTSQEAIYWQHVITPEAGGFWWCGTDDALLLETPPGYGNNWIQYLSKAFSLPTGDVSLYYSIQYDTEADYDFIYVQVSADYGVTFETIAALHGYSQGFVSLSSDLSAYANKDVIIRFAFTSDGGWSDEDGLYPTDGACRLDEVHVTGYPVDDFEQDSDGWIASTPEPIGGGPFRLETYLAGLGDGQNYAWAAYDFETEMFPFTPDEAKEFGGCLEIGIESPAIPIPENAISFVLEFDVYRDLPLNNLVFFRWGVAARFPGEDNWIYKDFNYIYYGEMEWDTFSLDITQIVPPGATEMKIRLIGVDFWIFEFIFGIPFSGVHKPAPFFDNVRILAELSGE